jgi:general stress protein 26
VKRELKALVASLLKEHNIMSVATVRPDGFPQATTVVYANDGVRLYFACDRGCQKVRNLARSPKVSVTIANDYEDWSQIRGLSIGGIAEVVKSPAEQRADTAVVRISPKVISVIDYRRGLGHTDLVEVGARAG